MRLRKILRNLFGTLAVASMVWDCHDQQVMADGIDMLDGANFRFVDKDDSLSVDEGAELNKCTNQPNRNRLTMTDGAPDEIIVSENHGSSSPSEAGGRRVQVSATDSAPSSPAGTWQAEGRNGAIRLVLKPDGTGTICGNSVRWQFKESILSLTGPTGSTVTYGAGLTENGLTVSGGNLTQPLVFAKVASEAGTKGSKPEREGQGRNGLVGRWQGSAGVADIKADGTMRLYGVGYCYIVHGETLTLIGDESFSVPFRLKGDALALTLSGYIENLKRMEADNPGEGPGAGRIAEELVGKWCYISSFSETPGDRSMADKCFTFFPDGTYLFRHRDGSGVYGATASQTDDTGTWGVAGSMVRVNSRTSGSATFNLEKRNHAETGNPMVCLDGRCFVTCDERPPWR